MEKKVRTQYCEVVNWKVQGIDQRARPHPMPGETVGSWVTNLFLISVRLGVLWVSIILLRRMFVLAGI